MKKITTIIAISVCMHHSFAQPIEISSSDAEKLSTMLGIDSIIKSTKEQTSAANKRQINIAIDQIQSQYPKISEAQKNALKIEAEKFLDQVSNSWGAEEVRRIYVSEISSSASMDDIRKAYKFYSTQSGMNVYVGVRNAEQKMISHIAQAQEKSMQTAMNELLIKMKEIVSKKGK